MKYCQTCGAELNELAEICPKCGVRCADAAPKKELKSIRGKGLGFVLAFFFGLIGAIICQFLGDDDAKKAAWITFGVSIALSVILYIIMIVVALGSGGAI